MTVDQARVTTDPDDKEYAVVTAGDTKVKSARKRRRNKEKEENKNLAAAASEGKAIEFDARSLRQVASLYRMNEKRAKNLGHAPPALPGGISKDDMDKIKDDGDEWLKTRDAFARANAAVFVGETAEQPLVVSNLGQVQQ